MLSSISTTQPPYVPSCLGGCVANLYIVSTNGQPQPTKDGAAGRRWRRYSTASLAAVWAGSEVVAAIGTAAGIGTVAAESPGTAPAATAAAAAAAAAVASDLPGAREAGVV